MNIKECAKVTGKSYPAIRRLCLKHCPGQFSIRGIGCFTVTDVRAKGKDKAVYDIERVVHSDNDEDTNQNNDGRSTTILKEQHLQVKIKKEQQLLYDNRALLIDKAKDIFVNIYHNPRLQEFSEIVRKYGQGNKELIDAWNYQITVGLDEKSKELQLALAELITN